MIRRDVFVNGVIVGAVAGKDRLEVNANARKYFPDVEAVGSAHWGFVSSRMDYVWVSPRFALCNHNIEWG